MSNFRNVRFRPIADVGETAIHRTMRKAVILLLFSLGGVAISRFAEAKSRTWPCSWVHGRMRAGNGTPSTRIWPVGTHRMLGVVDPRHPDDEVGEMPKSVLRLLTPENPTVLGDFYVCPVSPERAGWMRFVVVKKVRRLLPGQQ
jgi:hypothetical protein